MIILFSFDRDDWILDTLCFPFVYRSRTRFLCPATAGFDISFLEMTAVWIQLRKVDRFHLL